MTLASLRLEDDVRRAIATVALMIATAGAVGCSAKTVAAPASPKIILVHSSIAEEVGGLVAAIESANHADEPVQIVSELPRGTAIYLSRELPWVAGNDIEFIGEGIILRDRDCIRADGRRGCSGIVITGTRIVVRDVEATGFRFDGISVRGANEVLIENSRLHDNLDDGIGVSDHAKSVVIERCRLESNGFRSKGKGVLVFDHSEATLRENVIVANRDGVTVSKRAHAILERNQILDSYDKGFGVTGASAEGRDNLIAGSGAGRLGLGKGPNADGVRATIDAVIRLENSTVIDSGDHGVVAEGSSRIELIGARIHHNLGGDFRAGDQATIIVDGARVAGTTR